MKESIEMEESDGFLSSLQKIEKTKILPLRWFGNFLGSVATKHLLKSVWLDEDNNWGIRFKYHCFMWKHLNKPYQLWGTSYLFKTSNDII